MRDDEQVTDTQHAIDDIRERLKEMHRDDTKAHAAIGTKLDNLAEKYTDTRETLTRIDERTNTLCRDVGKQAARVDIHENRLDKIDEKAAEQRGKQRKEVATITGLAVVIVTAIVESLRQVFR